MAAICRARLLSDLSGQTVCDQEATSVDGRLCAFHSRQCQGMYRFCHNNYQILSFVHLDWLPPRSLYN
jgi:hypothetical protein